MRDRARDEIEIVMRSSSPCPLIASLISLCLPLSSGKSVAWEDKIELAMHTGNVGSPFRKILSHVIRADDL